MLQIKRVFVDDLGGSPVWFCAGLFSRTSPYYLVLLSLFRSNETCSGFWFASVCGKCPYDSLQKWKVHYSLPQLSQDDSPKQQSYVTNILESFLSGSSIPSRLCPLFLYFLSLVLGTCSYMRKTLKIAVYVRLYALKNSRDPYTDFQEVWYLEVLRKTIVTFELLLKLQNCNKHILHYRIL